MIYKNEDYGIDTETVNSCTDISTLEYYERIMKYVIVDIEFITTTKPKEERPKNFGTYANTQMSLMSQIKYRLKYLRKNTAKINYVAFAEYWMLKCKELDPDNFDRYRKQATAYVNSYQNLEDQ